MTAPFREFAAYLAAPRLVQPAGLGAPGAWAMWRALLALYLGGLLLVLAPLLGLWQRAMGLPSPEAFGQMPPLLLVPLVVVVAPVGEELAFRGWLTGRPRALWLLACALVAGGLLVLVAMHVAETAAALGFVGMGVVALSGWWRLRRLRDAPGWFVAGFPLAFRLSVLVFALAHLGNYPRFAWALLPMVLPQLWAGLVLGVIRMRIGLRAAMLAHALANASAVTLALAMR